MTNRLSKETSPYLLQHQHNPVDWYAWSSEALARAKQEDKPILLSIGYSACHWCHVMEHESFENPEIARLMNESFVCIKVDREERPDLDHIYQNVAQAMTRSGGWPLTVFLTPDLKPFYGGTYFPPEDRYGRPGFPRVLFALSQAYKTDLQSIQENADQLTEVIGELESIPKVENQTPELKDLVAIADRVLSRVDLDRGGLGGAPKFPNSMMFSFLWRLGQTQADPTLQMAQKAERYREAVLISLTKMASGGIYDQLGGGFHRYSVDDSWSVPHFEKMLYDNGLLLKLYAEVLLSEGPSVKVVLTDEDRDLYLQVLTETVSYIFREMTAAEGVFYSAQDADSEGEEGKFFVWDLKDLSEHLTSEEARVFSLFYGVTENGNFDHGKTVLYRSKSIQEVAQLCGFSSTETTTFLESSRKKLLAVRGERIRPGLDHKMLVSWNGLMISGLAWASQALQKNGQVELGKRAHDAAAQAFQFISKNLAQDGDRLLSTFQVGQPKGNAYLDDYAFMAMAALDLSRWAQSSKEGETYLQFSQKWIEVVLKHFAEGHSLGYFFTSDDHEKLIHRPKTFFDQAIPAGNAIALTCMAAFVELGMERETGTYEAEVQRQLNGLFKVIQENPYGMGELLCLSLLTISGPVTLSGPGVSQFICHAHLFQKPAPSDGVPDEAKDEAQTSEAKILICHQKACSLPLDSSQNSDSVIKLLAEKLRLT